MGVGCAPRWVRAMRSNTPNYVNLRLSDEDKANLVWLAEHWGGGMAGTLRHLIRTETRRLTHEKAALREAFVANPLSALDRLIPEGGELP